MTSDAAPRRSAWDLALAAARIFAADPAGFGGVVVRSGPGVVRDRWMSYVAAIKRSDAAFRRVPLHVNDERLLGGLDLAATLKAGRPIAARGLLAEADGGVVTLAGAERMSANTAAIIASAMDRREITMQRDGFAISAASEIGVICFDEGVDDEQAPASLIDRCAFLIDLTGVSHRDALLPIDAEPNDGAARGLALSVSVSDAFVEALCAAACAMGIDSLRAPMLAVAAARMTAALDGRNAVREGDAAEAAQLVLAPRARRLPEIQPDDDEADVDPPPAEDQSDAGDDNEQPLSDQQLEDMVLAAATAAIPAGLLASLSKESGGRARGGASGRSGVKQSAVRNGRPVGSRRGELKNGARLNLVETLRAAAPWQPVRRRETQSRSGVASRRVEVRKDDFRVARLKKAVETTMIFVVDASGSAALNRLAEAKGAVELLLADCYVRRDRVALIAFRGKTAELLLPPTRSLARAKRSLAGLPGGGGTPLALALEAAAELAETIRRKGQTANVILLTDGRANIARDGAPGRPKAEADSLAVARRFAVSGAKSLVIDTSPQPADQSAKLAAAMQAIYLPMPYADAGGLSRVVKYAIGSDDRRPPAP
jgi:magnesium chelatase subunit D